MRKANRKDHNHNEVAELFEKSGFLVVDLSGIGRGLPDLAVSLGRVVKLVEIKNPKTWYGRKGLNKLQQQKAASGLPFSVVLGLDQALEFITLLKSLPSDRHRDWFLYPKDKGLTPEQIDQKRLDFIASAAKS